MVVVLNNLVQLDDVRMVQHTQRLELCKEVLLVAHTVLQDNLDSSFFLGATVQRSVYGALGSLAKLGSENILIDGIYFQDSEKVGPEKVEVAVRPQTAVFALVVLEDTDVLEALPLGLLILAVDFTLHGQISSISALVESSLQVERVVGCFLDDGKGLMRWRTDTAEGEFHFDSLVCGFASSNGATESRAVVAFALEIAILVESAGEHFTERYTFIEVNGDFVMAELLASPAYGTSLHAISLTVFFVAACKALRSHDVRY